MNSIYNVLRHNGLAITLKLSTVGKAKECGNSKEMLKYFISVAQIRNSRRKNTNLANE